jgi:hypothetical protein
MMPNATVPTATAQLSIKIYRANGSQEDCGIVSRDQTIVQPVSFWKAMYNRLRRANLLKGVTMAAFLAWTMQEHYGMLILPVVGLVTNAGADYQADDFAGGGSDVGNFKYHESGTSSTAFALTQTDLLGKLSIARATGTNSKPGTYQFQSTGTITYNSSITVAEWGLFSAAGTGLPPSGGTLWDRRLTGSHDMSNGDSATFEYVCTFQSGGS